MTTGINRVHFFIAILCIASVLTIVDGIPPYDYCIGKGPCLSKGQDCGNYCLRNGYTLGGKCDDKPVCCCNAQVIPHK
ncbi:LCR-like protein [Medicago truncatula]|uniref:LCR-like protein n=1 Tax=Medicago truncatula TaxID=3880 RepID=G7IJF6_MEDTR|nr:LCR-like protein [Medicago truncatula]